MGGGCGGNCACAQSQAEELVVPQNCVPTGTISLDKEGRCPCGKTSDMCCHKDTLADVQKNDALDELCGAHATKSVC